MNIYFDIETLSTNDAAIIAELESTITAPGQYKKPDSIADWMKENGEAAKRELVGKTSFDGMYGRVACISWAHGDEQILSTNKDNDEATSIKRFYADIPNDQQITFVGHNIAGFDLPFLKHRSIILGIKPPPAILRAMNAKPWSEFIADTMLMWSQDKDKRVSIDKLCRALGISGKDGFDGSMVAKTWPTDPQKVIDYCRDDVERTRSIYKRMTFSSDLHEVREAA